jgi:hypothetical protein
MTSKRTISATNEAGFNAADVKIVVFARLDFAGGVQRFHTEIGPKTATHPIYGAEVYTGLGDFGGIASDVKEATSGAPIGITLALTGVDSGLINTFLTDDYFRRDAEIMFGIEDTQGDLIDDPEIMFSGFMDKVDIVFTPGGGLATMQLESRGTNLLTASDLRFTDEELQIEFSGDLLGEYIYRMADLKLRWGDKDVFGSGIGGPGDNQDDGGRGDTPRGIPPGR